MSNPASDAQEEPLHRGGAPSERQFAWQNIIAALICMTWNIAFLMLSLDLPAGHSRGDVGPGRVPMQIALLGLAVSFIYLVQALRGVETQGSDLRIDVMRVAGLVALFIAAAVSANLIGLAISLGVAAGVATLLFPGEKVLVRAVVAGLAFWAIAHFIFGSLLQLPLP